MTRELSRRLPPGIQIWQTEELANHWGFNINQLGYAETGMNMPDEVAMRLSFPAKVILLDYVEKAFTEAERAVNALDDQQFLSAEELQPMTLGVWKEGGTVGSAVMTHISHDNRHLGIMECILGLQGQPGTATR